VSTERDKELENELVSFIEEEVDSYADHKHESHYPSVRKNCLPKVMQLIKLDREAAVREAVNKTLESVDITIRIMMKEYADTPLEGRLNTFNYLHELGKRIRHSAPPQDSKRSPVVQDTEIRKAHRILGEIKQIESSTQASVMHVKELATDMATRYERILAQLKDASR